LGSNNPEVELRDKSDLLHPMDGGTLSVTTTMMMRRLVNDANYYDYDDHDAHPNCASWVEEKRG
jgi:hypothetical protein